MVETPPDPKIPVPEPKQGESAPTAGDETLTGSTQPSINTRKIIEIAVEEAADRLGVHPRTTLNLIKKGDLKGTKVAGRWYITENSVIGLLERKRQTNGNETSKPFQASSDKGQGGAKTLSYQSSSLEKTNSRLSNHDGPFILAAYRLCSHAFYDLDWDLKLPQLVADRIALNKCYVLEQLGAGFYSYGHDKKIRYSVARQSLGSLLGLLYPFKSDEKIAKLVRFIEAECISALVFLIRKLDKKPVNNTP